MDRQPGFFIATRVDIRILGSANPMLGRKERHQIASSRFVENVDGAPVVPGTPGMVGDQADPFALKNFKVGFREDIDAEVDLGHG